MITCIHCGKTYKPTFATKEIAKEFGKLMDVEQHISTMCSQKCWDELFKEDEEEIS